MSEVAGPIYSAMVKHDQEEARFKTLAYRRAEQHQNGSVLKPYHEISKQSHQLSNVRSRGRQGSES